MSHNVPSRPLGANDPASRVILAVAVGVFFTLTTSSLTDARDILRGGNGFAPGNGTANTSNAANAAAAQAATIAQRANDTLTRTTQALQDMKDAQARARAIAVAGANNLGKDPNNTSAQLPDVSNGMLPEGYTGSQRGLQVATGVGADLLKPAANRTLWQGANAPEANGSNISITQTAQQAILTWQKFDIGKNTTLTFDQSAGGDNVGQWIAFNKINDPSGVPSQILGSIKAGGQVYVLNQNGIIFGGASQVNTHALVASSLPINDNLVSRGLLSNPDLQFLFSSLPIVKLANGTMDPFTPTITAPGGVCGNVTVQQGAILSSPTTADHVGGKVALIGPNVTNEGTISTPDGQTILAAGQQVALTPHASNDASLRGLDVNIGAGGGTAQNSAYSIIDAPRGSITMAGKNVNQYGAAQSTTSVSLNGRIDLLASYGSFSTIFQNNVILFPTASGAVSLGAGSVTQVTPELTSAESVVGSLLSLSSQVNLQGKTIYMGPNAVLTAPSGAVTLNAGTWEQQGSIYAFLYSSGQAYLDTGAIIDVAGSENVSASVTDNIVSAQLRGTELANSPIQRNGVLRGKTVIVDARQSGSTNGTSWVGTPLADVSGYANLIQHTVGQLTVSGGSVAINAGDSFVMQTGSKIDVSGGWLNYKGGKVATSRLVSGSHIFDIANASADITYNGIYEGFTETHSRWNVSQTFTSPLLNGSYYDAAYLEGGAAGSLAITAPAMALDGGLYGNTVTGPRQLASAPSLGALVLAFQTQTQAGTTTYAESPTPPNIIFQSTSSLPSAYAFSLDNSGNPIALRSERKAQVNLSPDLFNENGFGVVTLANGDGNVTLPVNESIEVLPGGSLTITGANIDIEGKISVPAGSLSLTAYDYSPYKLIETSDAYAKNPKTTVLPTPVSTRGRFTLGTGAVLSAAGLLIDDRAGSATAELMATSINAFAKTESTEGRAFTTTLVKQGGKVLTQISTTAGMTQIKNYLAKSISTSTSDTGKVTTTVTIDDGSTNGKPYTFDSITTSMKDGGSIAVAGYNVNLSAGSAIDVSGGLAIAGNGKRAYGKGGSISISAGQDPNIGSFLGGSLVLNSELSGYGGFGTAGGSLSLKTLLIQIGGATTNADTLLLSPEFFDQGGFSGFSLTGVGAKTAQSDTYLTALSIMPGTILDPKVQSRLMVQGLDGLAWETVLLPEGVRPPVKLTFGAVGVKDYFTKNPIIRGAVEVGEGSEIRTDALGSVTLNGNTVAVLGSVYAPGGNITVTGGTDSTLMFASNQILPTVDLGPKSVLSTKGFTLVTPDARGYRTGSVLKGGVISIAGNIIAEAGAMLDVSGVSGALDKLATYSNGSLDAIASLKGQLITRTTIESNGGSISFNGGQELVINATLRGDGGGTSAQGGSLSITCAGLAASPTDVNLIVSQNAPILSTSFYPAGGNAIGHTVRDIYGNALAGFGYFGAESFNGHGLDSLSLGGVVRFSGAVTLNAPRSLIVADGGVMYGDSQINLIAPYVALGTAFQPPQESSKLQSPITSGGSPFPVSPQYGTGSLNVSASLIDIGWLSLQKIGSANFVATNGDIRGNGVFDVVGDITMTAGQIYPVTGAAFTIGAYDHGTTPGSVTFSSSGNRNLPLSAGGTLSVYGTTITQGGVLRAPLGTINLGWDGTGTAPVDLLATKDSNTVKNYGATTNLTLTAGGITSVSAIDPVTGSELIIPYGLNDNGSSWIAPTGATISASGLPAKAVNLSASKIDAQAGSTIDIRGGGDLLSYRFVKGTGGTLDILASSSSFAVIPGYQADYAPYASFNKNAVFIDASGNYNPGYVSSNLKVGDRVYLGASPGLPAGYYTLLPARYALLSGAYLVTAKSGIPVGTVTQPDGSHLVSGYRFNDLDLSKTGSGLLSQFEVVSSSVLAQRANYATYSADTFFAATSTVRLPKDSGQLVLQAKQAMNLAGLVLAKAPGNGRGGMVDINSPVDILIGNAASKAAVGTLLLDAAQLSAFGAESLLVGGKRSADGTAIEVKTNVLTVDNSGSPLTGPEIILVANKSLTLAPDADIEQRGNFSNAGETLKVSGLVQLASPGDAIALPSAGATLTFANGTPGNDAIISTSGGVISYANGATVKFDANTPTTLLANATVKFTTAGTVQFASGGTGGAIPITLGDGLLVRVSNNTTAVERTAVTTYPGPKMTIERGAKISGLSITLDSTYATDLSTSATLTGDTVFLNSGQISILLGGKTANNLRKTSGGQPTVGLQLAGDALSALTKSAKSLSLLSYSSIDIYGSGDVGNTSFQNLALHAADIRGFDSGAVTFTAQNILLDNSANGLIPSAVTGQGTGLAGTLTFNAVGQLHMGANQVQVELFDKVLMNAANGIIGESTGGFLTKGSLVMAAPLIAGATGANQTITAEGGALSILAANTTSTVTGGLGASLSLIGQSVDVSSLIDLPSGNLTLHATTGDVVVSGRLNAAGTEKQFFDATRYTSGGQINLIADQKSVQLGSTSIVSVAAPAGGADAGSLTVTTPKGFFFVTPNADGSSPLFGQGGTGGANGSFSLDVSSIALDSNNHNSLAPLDTLLNSSGFTLARTIRVRSNDVWVQGLVTAHQYNLSADGGTITIAGNLGGTSSVTINGAAVKNADGTLVGTLIDASGDTGGSINLSAHGSVLLNPGSLLTVAAKDFDSAGKGGSVSLEAATISLGNAPYDTAAEVNVKSGAQIDLSVASNVDAALSLTSKKPTSISLGKYTGTLLLRSHQKPSTISGALDVQIAPIAGTILNASKIIVEGYKEYKVTDGSIDNVEANVAANGVAFVGAQSTRNGDGSLVPGSASTGYTTMLGRLAGANATLASLLTIQPGAEIISTGDLTLSNDWDLSGMRFGINSVPGNLTLRAAGNLIFNGALSDGFMSSAYNAYLLPENSALTANAQAWSYRLVAGAELTASDFRRVQSSATLVTSGAGGTLQLGKFCDGADLSPAYDPSDLASGINNSIIKALTTDSQGNYQSNYQVIRTGSGDIDIFTGGDVQLLNQFATIYTAGTLIADPTTHSLFGTSTFALPQLYSDADSFVSNPLYRAQYSRAGGNVTINAQGNISHLMSNSVDSNGKPIIRSDSSRQLPTSWLYRRGSLNPDGTFGTAILGEIASTTWWIDFSNFFEGVGTLGGGNARVTAGGDINNIDVVAATNARMPSGVADANKMVELGGGDVTVRAGHDLNGGVYYVERGVGTLSVGNAIALHPDNYTRSPMLANIGSLAGTYTLPNSMDDWLPTTLFLGKGSFEVAAGGDATLGPVANAFLLPQGFGNTYWYKTYFSTYSTTDTVKISSLRGNVTLKEYAALPQSVDSASSLSVSNTPLLQIWLNTQLLLTDLGDTTAYYQPWLITSETSMASFTRAAALMPASLEATAFSGNINIVGNLTLSPSPTGSLNLLSAGAVNGLQVSGVSLVKNVLVNTWSTSTINLSDANPANILCITSPASFHAWNLANGGGSETQSQDTILPNALDIYFDESGATSTRDSHALLQVKQALHKSDLLHLNDSEPLRLYASTGDLSGITLFSGKESRVMAGNDIFDIAFYIQNVRSSDVSLVAAGRNITAYDSSLTDGGVRPGAVTLVGDIQINGQGAIEVLAGQNLDLGNGTNLTNGTGMGLTSIGNIRNPYLPFAGADIIAAAGLGGTGFDSGSMDFSAFTAKFLNPSTGGSMAERYLPALRTLLAPILSEAGLSNATNAQTWAAFNTLPENRRQLLELEIFYLVLRDAGRDHGKSSSAGYQNYDAGYAAIAALFPGKKWSGDISLTSLEIKTKNGGNISLLAPGGKVTVGYDRVGQALDQGILTEHGGNISIFAQNSVSLGTSRIFTLRGGNEIIWSTLGDIAAGSSSKTVQSAPPTRVLIDPQSADTKTDLSGLATGGGIGALETVVGVAKADIDLIAASGSVDAGDAGIRASGNLNVSAVQVLNASNIQVGGASTGTPVNVSANLGSLQMSVPNSATATNSAPDDRVAAQRRGEAQQKETIPSLITVEVLGYGGGEGD